MEKNSTSFPWTVSSQDSTEDEAKFCATPLWDLDLTWNTEDPDFTRCFHQTVLTYIPLAVLLIGSPVQVSIRKTSSAATFPVPGS